MRRCIFFVKILTCSGPAVPAAPAACDQSRDLLGSVGCVGGLVTIPPSPGRRRARCDPASDSPDCKCVLLRRVLRRPTRAPVRAARGRGRRGICKCEQWGAGPALIIEVNVGAFGPAADDAFGPPAAGQLGPRRTGPFKCQGRVPYWRKATRATAVLKLDKLPENQVPNGSTDLKRT